MTNTNKTEFPYVVKIDHIDKNGQVYDITADKQSCEALATRFDIHGLVNLTAHLKVTPQNARTVFYVTGQLQATVTQQSIVSGDIVNRDVTQDIEAWFQHYSNVTSFDVAKHKKNQGDESHESNEIEREMVDEKDEPESIVNGEIDLGELTSQFLGLALDDYPRLDNEGEGSGDYIEVKPEDARDNPFAALAQLKKDKD